MVASGALNQATAGTPDQQAHEEGRPPTVLSKWLTGIEQLTSFAGDLEVFSSGDHPSPHGRSGHTDVTVAVGRLIAVTVDCDTEEAQPLSCSAPYLGGVLSNSAGEHEHIDAQDLSSNT